jgi:hypothetical protein
MDFAIEIYNHLQELRAERALASIEDLATDSAYMADLDGEIEATTRVYVGPPSPRSRRCTPSFGPQVG